MIKFCVLHKFKIMPKNQGLKRFDEGGIIHLGIEITTIFRALIGYMESFLIKSDVKLLFHLPKI